MSVWVIFNDPPPEWDQPSIVGDCVFIRRAAASRELKRLQHDNPYETQILRDSAISGGAKMSVTIRDVRWHVARLQTVCKLQVATSHDAQGWRLESADGSRNLSPRLPTRQFVDWLDAYFEGFMAAKRGVTRDRT